MEKECNRCYRTLPLEEFYKHPAMPDGHLNQCKDCKRGYARVYRAQMVHDQEWVEAERERSREKYHRLYATGRKWVWIDAPDEVKKAARVMLGNAVRDGRITKPEKCQDCGTKEQRLEGHHPDYYQPLEVVWLCRKCHAGVHLVSADGKIHELL